MAVSLTTRLGLHRWSADTDPWSRSEFDDDNAKLEDLVLIALQGLNASRPAPGTQRRLYTAADSERVYIDDGDEWYEFGMLGTANTWLLAQKFSAQIDAAGGIISSVGALNLPDDVAIGGNLTVAGTFDLGPATTLSNPFTPAAGTVTGIFRKQGKVVRGLVITDVIGNYGGAVGTWIGATAAAWCPPAGEEAALVAVGARSSGGASINMTTLPADTTGTALRLVSTGALSILTPGAMAGNNIGTNKVVYAGTWMVA